MTDGEERTYGMGSRAAWRRMLAECLKNLGYPEDLSAAKLVAEREAAVAALRDVCGEHGDNDWDDDLHLADVIEQHLGRHLDAPEP